MTSTELCLCVDLGTGGPKVGLVTLDGKLVAYELHAVATYVDDLGAATQDAEEWWRVITEAARRLLDRSDVSRESVRAVAVTGQWASTVPVDANGGPTGPCLTWLDTRGGVFSRRAVGGSAQGYGAMKLMQFIKKTAGAPSTSGADPIGHILYLMNCEPELVERTRWFMEPVDYLTMRFTGVASATHASRTALWLTDNRRLNHFDYDPALLEIVGIDKTRLPPLVPVGTIVGPLLSSVAADLGLEESTSVVTGVPDLHAAAIGSGGTRPFETHLAISTSSWVSCPFPSKKTDVNHMVASIPGLTNDSYLVVDNQESGGKALEWLRATLTGDRRLDYNELTALAATSPPGANGTLFTPWLAGERSPVDDRRVRGGFTNLSTATTTADLTRAVMEGVAANSAWLFGYVEKFAGRSLSPVRVLGGGAQSELWCQIYADALDRDVIQVPDPMVAQLRGAALLASAALGRRALTDADGHLDRARTFEPDPESRDFYASRRRQFPELYRRDHKWSREQRSIMARG